MVWKYLFGCGHAFLNGALEKDTGLPIEEDNSRAPLQTHVRRGPNIHYGMKKRLKRPGCGRIQDKVTPVET